LRRSTYCGSWLCLLCQALRKQLHSLYAAVFLSKGDASLNQPLLPESSDSLSAAHFFFSASVTSLIPFSYFFGSSFNAAGGGATGAGGFLGSLSITTGSSGWTDFPLIGPPVQYFGLGLIGLLILIGLVCSTGRVSFAKQVGNATENGPTSVEFHTFPLGSCRTFGRGAGFDLSTGLRKCGGMQLLFVRGAREML
jgi:hypothetical protein